jgi:hypothetical protein
MYVGLIACLVTTAASVCAFLWLDMTMSPLLTWSVRSSPTSPISPN